MLRLYTTLLPNDVKQHRQLDCPLYETCLSNAARLRWKSFSCILCREQKNPFPQEIPYRIQNKLILKLCPKSNLKYLVKNGHLIERHLQKCLPYIHISQVLPDLIGGSAVAAGRRKQKQRMGIVEKYARTKL